jgi:hypothetical protein
MSGKFIDFEEIEELATIERLAQMLNLDMRRSGAQWRCECPAHPGHHRDLCISPQVRSKRGSLGVYFCQRDKSGGDRIGLVAHVMEIGQQDAAFFIAQQFGMEIANSRTVNSDSTVPTVSKERATVPPEQKREPTRHAKREAAFDPEAFTAKLAYGDAVAALGFSEEDAEHFGVGLYRGKVYAPLRHPDGSIACFYDYANGTLKLPARARWLEQSAPNVIPFGKKTA